MDVPDEVSQRMEIGSTYSSEAARRGLALTVVGIGDRVVFADPRATAGDVVRGLGGSDYEALVVCRTGHSLAPSAPLGLSDLRSGDVVELGGQPDVVSVDMVISSVSLAILSGPRKGEVIGLAAGEHRVGRAADNDIVIVDPGISRYHAIITVDRDSVTVADVGSTNGVMVDGAVIAEPTVIESTHQFLIGQSWMTVSYEVTAEEPAQTWDDAAADTQRILVTPGSNPLRPYLGERIVIPKPPERGRGWRRGSRDGLEAAANLYERSVQSVTAHIVKELDAEWTARLAETPSTEELVNAVSGDLQALWSRARTDPLLARIGLASLPSRTSLILPESGDQELRDRVAGLVKPYRHVDGVPVTVDFSSDASVLVAGYEEPARQLAFSLVAQLVLQHQPGRLRLWALLGPDQVAAWDWLKWLPHGNGYTDRGSFAQLTADPAEYAAVVDRLVASVQRDAGSYTDPARSPGSISAVVLIDGRAQVPDEVQQTIEELVNSEGPSSVCAFVVGQSDPALQLELPFGRRGTVIVVDQDWASMEVVVPGDEQRPAVLGIDYEVCSDPQIADVARRLTRVEPLPAESSAAVRSATPAMFWSERTGARPGEDNALDGLGDGLHPSALVERWAHGKPNGRLTGRIGSSASGELTLDLRELGPHAIVSGDLAGFLPAWVSSLAARYSPNDLTFYLIDSTGGTVFRQCRELPHTIGNLSNTSTLEIKPALAMLSAELDRREAVLGSLACHSIEELERQGRTLPFPYLVVGIDRVEELGGRGDESVVTLDPASELLSLCERGQQLGMHLLLGTESTVDPRLADRIALHIHASRYCPSRLSVGQAPAISFNAALTSLPPEVVVRSFSIDDTSELSRELLPVMVEDDLERLTTLIRNAHEYSGDPLPSGLG